MNRGNLVSTDQGDLEGRIRKRYESFSKGFKKVAAYILQNRDNLPFISALNLGKEIGVSESTVLRFVRLIGYDGYPDLQKDLTEWIRKKIKPAHKLKRSLGRKDKADIYSLILDNDIRNILSLKKNMAEDQLEQVTKLLIQARRVYVLGFRTSYSMAYLCSFLLARILNDIVLLKLEDHNFYTCLGEANEKDVILAFSFPRYSKHTLEIVQFLKKKGCKVIGTTDRHISPLGCVSDYVIEVNSSSPTYFNSFTGVVSAINCIVARISWKHPQRSMTSLRKGDDVVDDFDILVL